MGSVLFLVLGDGYGGICSVIICQAIRLHYALSVYGVFHSKNIFTER